MCENMSKKVAYRTYDLIAKLLLVWFIYETFAYFYSGRFVEQIGGLKYFGEYSIPMDIYTLLQISVSAIGVIVFIPLILKGYKSGLVVWILYWVMGYAINPLWYAIPRSMQSTPTGKATSLLTAINISWAIFTLLIITTFYFYRRKQIRMAISK